MSEGLLDKEELVRYIICKFKETQSKEISPIKLQKSLYFLFAMWGGKVLGVKNDEEDYGFYSEFNPYLFNANFQAWKFGPVDRSVWEKYRDGEYDLNDCNTPTLDFHTKNQFEKTTASEYIDGLLQRIFNTSDFGLVDLSHEDNCWKRAYNSVNKIINSKDIIEEYASR
ncbi:MAG: DUF4065 domain-containing protein [Erysipelotrichia bacterium]|nr:DUF4065 domain-containing protein [Erysipelotrichia bacterium]